MIISFAEAPTRGVLRGFDSPVPQSSTEAKEKQHERIILSLLW